MTATTRQELSEKNDDLAAWILIPAVDISYPVLQGEDNEYYLHRDINQEYLFAGSIFMDAYNNASFYNYNTIIYGHNMRDGSMFARLKEFSNEATLRQCPYFWILTPDADYLYKICSIHQASSGSDTFTVRFADYEEYKLWQDKMLSLSVPETGEALEYQDRVVTLSTCTENSYVRMTVHGKLVWKTS
jgi:sortase B